MSDKSKVIGAVTAILGLLAAVFVVLTRHQEYKKSAAETDIAEQHRRVTQEELKAKAPKTTSPLEPAPPSGKSVSPNQAPVQSVKLASELFAPNAAWEGPSGTYKMRMEVKTANGQSITGKLHWYEPGGKHVVSARMTGRVVDPDQVSFQYRFSDVEFGVATGETAYAGTVHPAEGELRGNWGGLSGPLNGGTFVLRRLR